MRTAYRALAYLIAFEVVVQAASISYAFSGLGKWVQSEGGVLDKGAMEGHAAQFEGMVGFPIHATNGQMVIPVLAVLLLIVSLFAKVTGGVRMAAVVLALVVIQVVLGLTSRTVLVFGALHGVNALLLFGAAFMAGHLVRPARDQAVVA